MSARRSHARELFAVARCGKPGLANARVQRRPKADAIVDAADLAVEVGDPDLFEALPGLGVRALPQHGSRRPPQLLREPLERRLLGLRHDECDLDIGLIWRRSSRPCQASHPKFWTRVVSSRSPNIALVGNYATG